MKYTEEEAKKRKEEIYKEYPFVAIKKDTPFEIARKAFLDNTERGLLVDEVNAHTEQLKRNSQEVGK
jgi:hypothetical protein